MKIDVTDKIIIFDEAHNIESKAEDSCSFELLENDLLASKKYFNNKDTPTIVKIIENLKNLRIGTIYLKNWA